MSVKSWMEEFYPIPAEEATGTDLIAAEHSLWKWRGLDTSALQKHGLVKEPNKNFIYDSALVFYADDASCALCYRYMRYTLNNSCYTCPIFKAGGIACDEPNSSYIHWMKTGDTKPIVRDLKAAVKWCKEQS